MEEDFKFEFLKRKQLVKIIESYNLPIDKTLSYKKMLEAIKQHLEITDDGYIVHKEDKSKNKEELEGTGKYRKHLMKVKIKVLN